MPCGHVLNIFNWPTISLQVQSFFSGPLDGDMPQQQELTMWSPEVIEDVYFSLVAFHMHKHYDWQELLVQWQEEVRQNDIITFKRHNDRCCPLFSNEGMWSERLS